MHIICTDYIKNITISRYFPKVKLTLHFSLAQGEKKEIDVDLLCNKQQI